MSFEDDLKDVGDSIGKLVDNAVNSQDFQELNRKISDTINQFVYPNRKGPFRANGTQEPSRGYSADTSYSSQHSSHNNTAQQTGPHHYSYGPGGTMPGKSANPVPKPSHTWQPSQNTEWNSRIQERRVLRERFMPSTDLALVGGFQTAAGWGVTGLFGCCTALSLYSLFAGPDNSALIPSLIFAAFTIGGDILLKKGSKNRRLVRHFRQICTLIGTKEYISTKELCDSMHCEKGELLTDITTMIDKSMLRQGHLDENGTCLMVTNDCYDQYRAMLASQKEQQIAEQKAREQLEASGVTPEYQQMLEECESYIQKIHQCNLDLPGEVITAKLSRLETVVTRILEEAKKRPKEAAALRKFMDYYMPTTWKLLDAYRSFENEPIQSDNILRTKKEIEDTLDTINAAFEKLLDDLFQTTAWDISSDISVLQTMLAQEGLTNQAGPSKQDIEPLHM